ncbi:hypothetical protein Taro_048354 [Colocasia esculenta]|uniref:Uncharacterized protein n=1 Tax=Colocasia esculenta TaxID=4460 RepID=A0A843X2K3_COLES|nr:hypothetical protein [Colocasia esculenta]
MADPLASWMWSRLTAPPQDVGHVIINVDKIDRSGPEVVEKIFLAAAAPDSDAQVGQVDLEADDGVWNFTWGELLGADDWTRKEEEAKEFPTIWTVHPSVRKEESEAYDPMFVSIGPLHHGNDRLLPMQNIKLRFVKNLIRRSPKNSMRNYIKAIYNCEDRARKQYAKKIDLSKEEFVTMLVLDGCFIIEFFLRQAVEGKETTNLFGVGWSFTHLRRDLMLLENQIPFFVPVKLFEMTDVPSNTYIKDGSREKHGSNGQLAQLNPVKTASYHLSRLFYGLLYLVFIHELPRCNEESKNKNTIPSAVELHDSGVKFKRKVSRKDEKESYLDVTFTQEGTLEIPFFRVGQSASSHLLNFIALEQCQSKLNKCFTVYAIFMCNIIKIENDVSVLRKYGIIETTLGNDEEVAKMFNSLLKGTHLHYKQSYFISTLFKDVKKYCDVPHHRWRAKVVVPVSEFRIVYVHTDIFSILRDHVIDHI